MAAGRFTPGIEKVRPGTYTNFESTRKEPMDINNRGTVLVPLARATYGPVGEFITISNKSPDSAAATLGYSVYDSDNNRQMLLLREAMKKASKVIVYIIGTGGVKASAMIGAMTATAKYAGTRGNDLRITIVTNPISGFDVTITLDAETVALYESISTVEELIAQNCPYIDFAVADNGADESKIDSEDDSTSNVDDGTALEEIAGIRLEGGEDPTVDNAAIIKFLNASEGIRWDTMCFPFTDESLKAAALVEIQYIRENMGHGVQVVMPDYAADYEGVINVTNSVILGDDELTHAETCAWVAGATAGAKNTESLTYVAYDGATAIADPKTNEEIIAALKRGEFLFSISEDEEVVVEQDINSLVTFDSPKDSTYRKNRIQRVFSTLEAQIQATFPPNRFSNNSTGWDIMDGIGRALLLLFLDAGAIQNLDEESDFAVDRTRSADDSTYFNVYIQPVDSSEKLYFTTYTR